MKRIVRFNSNPFYITVTDTFLRVAEKEPLDPLNRKRLPNLEAALLHAALALRRHHDTARSSGGEIGFGEHFAYVFSMMDKDNRAPTIDPNGPRNHLTRRERSISAPLLCDRHTLAARAIRWIIPWSRDTFPGLRAGVREVLGRPTIAWATVQGWRADRSRMPADDAERLAHFIRTRSERGMELAKELEDYAAKRRAEPRQARGFEIVKDWDGAGIETDRRWRGGKGRSEGGRHRQ